MTKRNTIEDVGEVLPFAKKHLNIKSDFQPNGNECALSDLWPEPNWENEIDNGLDEYVAANLAMIYQSLRKKPRVNKGFFSGISDQAWLDAYIEGIHILKGLFFECETLEDVDELNNRFASQLGFPGWKQLQEKDLSTCLPYWAINRGDRTLRHPTSKKPSLARLADYLPDLSWPESNIAIKVGRFPIAFNDGTYGACWSSGNSVSYNKAEVFDTLDDTLDFIRELHQAELDKQETPEYQVPKKPACINVARTGPEYRTEAVSAEQLMGTFRFRGIQFGASMGEKEKQNWINAIYDGFCDLSLALNIPKSWIGLKGLGLAFGARGSGNALAHYETDLRVINLTRTKGASSSGHEWSHALDHKLVNTINGTGRFASHKVLRIHHCNEELMQPTVAALSELMKNLTRRDSGFYQRSARVQGIKGARKYWTEPHELFARAFECYLQDILANQSIVNPWLVYGTCPEDYPRFVEETFPYPLGIEREETNQLFLNLFTELNKLS